MDDAAWFRDQRPRGHLRPSIALVRRSQPIFTSPTKGVQRELLRELAPDISQPTFAVSESIDDLALKAEAIGFPVVVKPGNSGGGLGVEFAGCPEDIAHIADRLGRLRNYGGTDINDFVMAP